MRSGALAAGSTKPASAWGSAAVRSIAFLLGLLMGVAVPASAQIGVFQLPLDPYPVDDNCGAWGALNANFPRCGAPGIHVADDACVPNNTTVYAVAHGYLRLAEPIGTCTNNWGWVIVMEHPMPDGGAVCAVYGHCSPLPPYTSIGMAILKGSPIAVVNNTCLPHIHFGIYLGPYGNGNWLLGYLPEFPCETYPTVFPGSYVDPVSFVAAHSVAAEPVTWGQIKSLYR